MKKSPLFALIALCPMVVFGATIMVSSDSDLQSAIITANGAASTVIEFQNDITLGGGLGTNLMLRPVNTDGSFVPTANDITFNTLNSAALKLLGASSFRGLFIDGTSPGTVLISNITFENCTGKGGRGGTNSVVNGSRGGGGGAGMGGAIYAASGANVTFNNPTFSSCTAQGGDGSASTVATDPLNFYVILAQGGGGFAGNGGDHKTNNDCYGGTGGGGINAKGGDVTVSTANGGGGGGAGQIAGGGGASLGGR